MTKAEIIAQICEKFHEIIKKATIEGREAVIQVGAEDLLMVCQYLKSEPTLAFDYLMYLAGLDYPDRIEVVYHLFSMVHRHKLFLRVELPRETPRIPSVTSIWKGANWHERETYDLLGVKFDGHPDLRRILLPEDWSFDPPLWKNFECPEMIKKPDVK